MPPFHVFRDFLRPEERDQLLEWALVNEGRFENSRLAGRIFDPSRRISRAFRDLGTLQPILEKRVRIAAPEIFSATGTRPFEIGCIELELAAHGEGAHFAPHTDIPVGLGRKPLGGDGTGQFDRIVSGVYYFYQEPKRFSGGELRLHRFGSTGEDEDIVDIEPEQNSFLVFPSWATHEVRTVRGAEDGFASSRFAVNCWICRRTG